MAKGMATAAMHAKNHSCINGSSSKAPCDFDTHINPDGEDGGRVHKDAIVHHSVTIDRSAVVYAGARIDEGVIIGPRTEVHAASIGAFSTIGSNARIYSGTRILGGVTIDDGTILDGKSQDIIKAAQKPTPKRTVYIRRAPR